ncbi:MAG: hypothetical protein ACR2HY_03190, partial [Acidimicrobiales bacterium]
VSEGGVLPSSPKHGGIAVPAALAFLPPPGPPTARDSRGALRPDGPPTARSVVGIAPDLATAQLAAQEEPPPTVAPAPRFRHSQAGVASWFHFTRGTCASRSIAKGTVVTVTRPATKAVTTCRVADWGPGDTTRLVDLSEDTFARLAGPGTGLVQVRVQW